ncbi:MAG TPA: methyltransferase [Candidatus Sulfomarinibacteraceae bacterium]|nr:methyltransferase [Candidatus Sulfomarinibacteraceae bacterium]
MTESLDLDGLQRLLWTFAGQRVVTVAGRTGILGRLADAPASPEAVAADLGLNPLATGKVVRALHALGLVTAGDGDGYVVVDTVRRFFRSGDEDFTPFLEHSHSMYEAWGANLEPWLRGDGWESPERTPERTRRFGEAMRAMGTQVARRVAAALDLESVARVLDVGGGWGQYARAICDRAPAARATVLDIPQVAEAASASVAGTGLEGRLSWIGGDYLETDFGTGYDLVLLANILHQELAPDAAELVRRAAAATEPGGRVAVVDFRIDDAKREHLLGTLFAINMRSFGDTYSEPELQGWMEAAGLVDIERTDIGPDRWLITGSRPRSF